MSNNLNLVQLGRQIQQGTRRKHTVQIDLSDINKEWVGTFVFRYPSLMEQMQIGVLKTNMLGGLPPNSVDVLTDNIAHMTATLSVVMESAPDWFDLNTLEDYEALDRVYEAFAKWRDSFRLKGQGSDNQGNSQATGDPV